VLSDKIIKKESDMQLKNLCEILSIIIFTLIIFTENVPAKKKHPFIDPNFVSGEKSTYEVIKNGKVYFSDYKILCGQNNSQKIYIICTQSYKMTLEASNLQPIYIEKTDYNGEVEFSIKYSADRVHFVYPGPKRNIVEKIPENTYDVHAVLQSVRGFPSGQEESKLTLVTPEHPDGVGFYIKIVRNERITTPAGDFDCYYLEAGVDGLLGKVIKKKFFFWLEKKTPYRLVKYTDSDGERTVTLIDYEIPQSRP
jgi:hypothetical protein